LHGTRAEIVRHRVRLPNDVEHDLPSGLRLEVQGHALLAGVARSEVAAAVHPEFPVLERSAGTNRIEPRRAFDLDDVRAEIREDLGPERTGPGPGEIGNADVFQELWPHDQSVPSQEFRISPLCWPSSGGGE